MAIGFAFGQASSWNVDANGNWGTSGNWTPATIPNAAGATATLGGVITAARTVALNNNYRVGTLTINSDFNYTIGRTAGGTRNLTFDVTSGNAAINVLGAGSPGVTGNARFVFADTVEINHTGTGVFTLGTPVSGAGGLIHSGSGRTDLTASNTYTGLTRVQGGQLVVGNTNALGGTAAGTEVASGGSLALTGGVSTAVGEALTISGAGSGGALRNIGGSSAWRGNITLADDATIANGAAGTEFQLGTSSYTEWINLAGKTLVLDGPGRTFINSNISGGPGLITGAGDLVKRGTGTAVLYGDENYFTGSVTVEDGTLDLDTITGRNGSIKGTQVFVGDGVGAAGSAVLANGQTTSIADEMINDSATIALRSDGLYLINDETETIGALTFAGGQVSLGAGQLIFNAGGPATAITTSASASTALINTGTGTINLNGSREVAVADGAAATDLEIRGRIAGDALTKTGAGELALTGSTANTYSGNTVVDGGTLRVAKDAGVAAIAGPAVEVNAGGTLLFGASDQILDSASLTLNGGILDTGAGFGETLGTLTLLSDSSINLGSASHLLQFAASGAQVWTGALTIYGWAGAYDAPGTQGRLFFGNSASGLSFSQLALVNFDGYAGGARLLDSGELVPMAVPAAPAQYAAILIVLLAAWREGGRIFQRATGQAG